MTLNITRAHAVIEAKSMAAAAEVVYQVTCLSNRTVMNKNQSCICISVWLTLYIKQSITSMVLLKCFYCL